MQRVQSDRPDHSVVEERCLASRAIKSPRELRLTGASSWRWDGQGRDLVVKHSTERDPDIAIKAQNGVEIGGSINDR